MLFNANLYNKNQAWDIEILLHNLYFMLLSGVLCLLHLEY